LPTQAAVETAEDAPKVPDGPKTASIAVEESEARQLSEDRVGR